MPIDEKSINRFGARPALIVFLVCLAVGWTVVGWHASRRATEAKRVAQLQAQVRLAALELQLRQSTSPRWPEIIKAARLSEIKTEGYDYVLFAVAQQRPIKLDGQGTPSLEDSVIAPLRVGNLDLRLALQKPWVSKTKVVLEGLGVLVFATLLCLIINLLENREALEESLNDMNRRLTRESAERQQALEECQNTRDEAASIQTELKAAQEARTEAEAKIADFQTKLRGATEGKEAALAKLHQSEASLVELQTRLESALQQGEQTAEARKAERAEARATIEQAQKTISEMKARLEAAASAEKKASATAQSQLEKAQATISDLQSKLESATRSAKEAAEKSATKLKQAENTIDELKQRLEEAEQAEARIIELNERLNAAEQAEARVAELTALLEKTQAELVAHQNAPEVTSTEEVTPPDDEAVEAVIEQISKIEEVTEPVELEKVEEKEVAAIPLEPTEEKIASLQPEAPAEPAPEPVPSKPPKRKKARRDEQMDFFSAPQPVQTPPTPEAAPEKELFADPTPLVEPAVVVEKSAPEEAVESPEVTATETKPEKPAPARKLPPPPPLDEAEFRKAVHEILPLLADRDPGAKDCLKANRNTYRSGFSAEGYEEFEHAVKSNDYNAALELLRKAGRRHGVSV